MTPNLTRTEETLVVVLSALVSARSGSLAREAGYPAPTVAQSCEIVAVQVRAIVEIVRGLRAPGESPDADEIEPVVEGLAEGGLLKVLGSPPSRESLN